MLGTINRRDPRLEIVVDWGGEVPAGAAFLFVGRVGGPEFAVYTPLEVRGGNYIFQFDELLFSHEEGRYYGRFVIGVTTQIVVEFEYRTNARILRVSNPNVHTRT